MSGYDRTYREEPIWQYDGTGAYDPVRYNYLDLAERPGSRPLARASSVLPAAVARGRQGLYDDSLPPLRSRDYYHEDPYDDPYYYHSSSSYSDRDSYRYPRSRSSHHSSYYDSAPVPVPYGSVAPASAMMPSSAMAGSSVLPVAGGYAAEAPYTMELRVPICCEGCERRIVRKLLDVPGVMTVRCDIVRQKVSVRGAADADDVLRAARRAFPKSRMWM